MLRDSDRSTLIEKTESLIREKGTEFKLFAVYSVEGTKRIYSNFFSSMAELSRSGLLQRGYCAEMMTAENLLSRLKNEAEVQESSGELADQVKNAVLKDVTEACSYPDGYVFIDFTNGICGLVNGGKCGTEKCNVPKGMIEEFVPDEALAAFRHCTACGFDLRDRKFLICAALSEHSDNKLPGIGEFHVTAVYDAPLVNETEILASIGLGMGPMDMLSDFLGEVFRKLTSGGEEEPSEVESDVTEEEIEDDSGDDAEDDPGEDIERDFEDEDPDDDWDFLSDPDGPLSDEELEDILPVNTAMALASAVVNQLWYARSYLIDDYDDDADTLTDCLYALHCRSSHSIENMHVSDEEAEEILTDVLSELAKIAEEKGKFSEDSAALLQLVQIYTGLSR